jgi:hypothetical protein
MVPGRAILYASNPTQPLEKSLMTERTTSCLGGAVRFNSSIKPSTNIWAASAPVWACLDPALERVEQQPAPPKPTPTTGQ